MNEIDLIDTINNSLTFNSYLGDDCAYLEDLDIFVTHDTLVEDVHFSRYTTNPYFLGRKSVAVNLSDLAAALCIPKYITVSLSMPFNQKKSFVEQFYKGINEMCSEYNIKVIGGDLTASEKTVISICAVGKKSSLFLSSRKFAKKNDYVILTGFHGMSSAGLYALSQFLHADDELLQAHLNPIPKINEGKILANIIDNNIAVMDTSDGLVDALYKIASASKHSIEFDINKVPLHPKLAEFCSQNSLNFKNFVKWGGEDYGLVACVPEEILQKLDASIFTCIGRVMNKDTNPCVVIKDGKNLEKITKDILISNTFNHFEN